MPTHVMHIASIWKGRNNRYLGATPDNPQGHPRAIEGYEGGDNPDGESGDTPCINRRRQNAHTGGQPGQYVVIGWKTRKGVPVDDYQDFGRSRMNFHEVRYMCAYGHFPPGLMLERDGIRYLVKGAYCKKQSLIILERRHG